MKIHLLVERDGEEVACVLLTAARIESDGGTILLLDEHGRRALTIEVPVGLSTREVGK